MNTHPLKPSICLLCKLGAVISYADELRAPLNHPSGNTNLDALLDDPDVKAWIEAMAKLTLLPKQR